MLWFLCFCIKECTFPGLDLVSLYCFLANFLPLPLLRYSGNEFSKKIKTFSAQNMFFVLIKYESNLILSPDVK